MNFNGAVNNSKVGYRNRYPKITKTQFINREDRRTANVLAYVDGQAQVGHYVAETTCPSVSATINGINSLKSAVTQYNTLLDSNFKFSEQTLKTITKSRDDCVVDLSHLRSAMQTCINLKENPGIISLVSSIISNGAPQRALEKESGADDKFKEKILACRRTDTCNLKRFDDMIGGNVYKNHFQQGIVNRLVYTDFKRASKGISDGILLYGPPGTGKTTIAEAVAQLLSQYNVVFYNVNASTITGSYQSESSKCLSILFELARKDAQGGKVPVVIFIDEIDGLFSKEISSKNKDSGEVLSTFNSIFGSSSTYNNDGIIFIAGTNFPKKINDAIISRCTDKLLVGNLSMSETREYVQRYLKKLGSARFDLRVNPTTDFQTNFNVPVEGSDPASVFRSTIAGSDINKMANDLSNQHYSARDLRNIFHQIDGICMQNAVVFASSSHGEFPDASKRKILPYAPYQWWIREQTKYEHYMKGADGTCHKKVEDGPIAYIPLRCLESEELEPENLPKNISDYVKYQVNSNTAIFGRYPTFDAENYRLVLTKRTKGLLNFEKSTEQYTYTVIAMSDDKGVIHAHDEVEIFLPENLGMTQFTYATFEEALKKVKPVAVENLDELEEFTANGGLNLKENIFPGPNRNKEFVQFDDEEEY